MSNYCKRIAKQKKIIRGEIIQEKCTRKSPFTEISIGPIKRGCSIGKAIAPAILYLHNKGAENIDITIDDEKRTVSISTHDCGIKEFEKEMNSPIVENVVKSLATLAL